MGEKIRSDAEGKTPKALDHDPPAKRKWTQLGILVLATGALMLIFGTGETSDFWVDALKVWWLQVRAKCGGIRRLVIYLDNGPNNAGTLTQFLKRMIEFADWSGLEMGYNPSWYSQRRQGQATARTCGVCLAAPSAWRAPSTRWLAG